MTKRGLVYLVLGLMGMLGPFQQVMVASAQSSNPPVENGILTPEQLQSMADRIRSFAPRDEFDVQPALPSLQGRRFSYTVTPLRRGPDNLICAGFPSWGYWPQEGRLEVGGTESLGMRSDFRSGNSAMFAADSEGRSPFVTFRALRCQKTRLPNYTARNGFGAEFDISATRETVTAIGDFGDINTSWRTYWSAQTTGDAARQLSQNVRVRVSGTLSDWAPGRPLFCGTSHRLPTVDLPIDDRLSICLFRGQADLFEVIDARTGAVLFSSPRQRRD
jgi:hypothetical protein